MKYLLCLSFLIISCSTPKKAKSTDQSIQVGSAAVNIRGQQKALVTSKKPIAKNKKLSSYLKSLDTKVDFIGKVSIVNVVPSIDTKVCEEQTHILGEDKSIHPDIQRVTISRDLPMAHRRFASEASLENIEYISDFKDASFGKSSGLLLKESGLLARGVMVVDQQGVIRYMQFVPELTELPNMKKAIDFANSIIEK